jgi:MYXO-CTERM domain-containing protein
MKRFALTAAGVASAAVVASTSADVTVEFDTGNIVGLSNGGEVIFLAEGLTGTFTGMDLDVDFYASNSSGVWASDLLVAVSDGTFSAGLEWGGFNTTFGFADGGSFNWGRSSYGENFSSFSGYNMAVNNGALVILNGWSTSPGGSWRGTITLYGVDAVPAPGALALLGVAGLAGRRRRG